MLLNSSGSPITFVGIGGDIRLSDSSLFVSASDTIELSGGYLLVDRQSRYLVQSSSQPKVSSLLVTDNSRVIVSGSSELILDSALNVILQMRSTLFVNESSFLRLEPSSNLVVGENSTLTVQDSGSTLLLSASAVRIQPNGIFSLDGAAQAVLNSGSMVNISSARVHFGPSLVHLQDFSLWVQSSNFRSLPQSFVVQQSWLFVDSSLIPLSNQAFQVLNIFCTVIIYLSDLCSFFNGFFKLEYL